MKPGRELDALIAEHVFKQQVVEKNGYYSVGEPIWDWIRFEGSILLNEVPYYSTDIADAWEVVMRFNYLYLHCHTDKTTGWEAQLKPEEQYLIDGCESAPHAICLAALKAVGYNE